MSSRNARRAGAAIVLAAALAVAGIQPAAAAPRGRGTTHAAWSGAGLLQKAWGWIVGLWANDGGGISPNGGRSQATGCVAGGSCIDDGGGISPNG